MSTMKKYTVIVNFREDAECVVQHNVDTIFTTRQYTKLGWYRDEVEAYLFETPPASDEIWYANDRIEFLEVQEVRIED